MQSDVIVVGAGLTGLVAAYRLQHAGLRVTTVEAAERAGGVIGTGTHEGYLFELGPNTALDSSPEIGTLLDELRISDQRIDTQPEATRRYVVRAGRLVALPHSAASFVTTPLLSLRGKLRLLAEPFVRRASTADESVAAFIERRLGPEVLETAVAPFVSGIYAGDPEQLSVAATFPRLHQFERDHGSLLRGAIAARRSNRATRPRRIRSFSFRNGLQTLTDALAGSLPTLRCGVRALRVARHDGGDYRVDVAGSALETLAARAVVLALPAYAAATLVDPLTSDAAAALRAIPYAPLAVIVSGYRRQDIQHPLDGFGFLAAEREQLALLGTLFSSSLFAGRASSGHVLLTSFVGGARHPTRAALSEAEIASIVGAELGRLLGAGSTLFRHVKRWPQAIPQYTIGHLERIARLDAAERALPGLFFCGNYRGGVAIGDCIVNGGAVAEKVVLQAS
jgi:oxygen-dependent protoporphyrinogen oxidase